LGFYNIKWESPTNTTRFRTKQEFVWSSWSLRKTCHVQRRVES